MRGLHPSNAGELPMTRNMPFSTKTMPSKFHNRNMTGIYLGLVSVYYYSDMSNVINFIIVDMISVYMMSIHEKFLYSKYQS